jgi:hypothetical protein
MVISILYMFRATVCPSSGEITVSIRHLVFVTPCRWPSGVQGGMELCCIYTVISADDGCPKHVGNRNKHTNNELCTGLVLYTILYSSIDFEIIYKEKILFYSADFLWLLDCSHSIYQALSWCIVRRVTTSPQ